MQQIDREKTLQAAQKYIEKKRYDRAIAEYQRIVQDDPNDARTLLKIGDLQARLSAYPEAIATYDRVGQFYAAQGFALKAIAVYKQIREIIKKHVPNLADRYSHITPLLAELYTQLGLVSDALAAYGRGQAHDRPASRWPAARHQLDAAADMHDCRGRQHEGSAASECLITDSGLSISRAPISRCQIRASNATAFAR